MAIGVTRYFRSIAIICVIIIPTTVLIMYKIERYLLGEENDDISIIILKVFMDICVLLCLMLYRFHGSQQRKCSFFITLFTVLKCLDMLVFISLATLILKYGYAYIMFLNVHHNVIHNEETSIILMLSVILVIGYWSAVFFLYTFMTFYKPNLFERSACEEQSSQSRPNTV